MQNQLKLIERNFKTELNELMGSSRTIDAQKAQLLCQEHLEKSKDFFLKLKNVSPPDEIYYFKHFKPKILAKIIYFKKIKDIQHAFPLGNEEVRINYINTHLQNGFLFFTQYSSFINYYRNKQEHLDLNFFIRENAKLHTDFELRFLSIDFSHSTGYDEILAEYLALEKIQLFLESIKNDMGKLHNIHVAIDSQEQGTMKWTASKAALVEVIYGLTTVNAINHGQIEVKRIAGWIEKSFNLQIDDIYKVYAEIKNRKGERAKFLKAMTDTLLKRMDADDASIT